MVVIKKNPQVNLLAATSSIVERTLVNSGKMSLEIIEIQPPSYPGEDDTLRIKDVRLRIEQKSAGGGFEF